MIKTVLDSYPVKSVCDTFSNAYNFATKKIGKISKHHLAIFCLFYPISKLSVPLSRALGIIKRGYTVEEKVNKILPAFLRYVHGNYYNDVCVDDQLLYQNVTMVDVPRIASSKCPLQEFFKQANFWLPLEDQLTFFSWRNAQVQSINRFHTFVSAPIQEEWIFRHLIQECLLKHLPRILMSKSMSPSSIRKILDSTAAKVIRILISSAMFSAFHIINTPLDDNELQNQMTHTFVLGLFLGTLVETDVNYLGCMALHSLYNILALLVFPFLDSCNIFLVN